MHKLNRDTSKKSRCLCIYCSLETEIISLNLGIDIMPVVLVTMLVLICATHHSSFYCYKTNVKNY